LALAAITMTTRVVQFHCERAVDMPSAHAGLLSELRQPCRTLRCVVEANASAILCDQRHAIWLRDVAILYTDYTIC
jgi:hypothetical protein